MGYYTQVILQALKSIVKALNTDKQINQRTILILALTLYLIPFIGWFGFGALISSIATGYKDTHRQLIKVWLINLLFAILSAFTISIFGDSTISGFGIVILIIIPVWYYSYMIIQLLRALKLKAE